ncbi:MAG: phage major capsid protein [Gammaproteobacteria bacterium]
MANPNLSEITTTTLRNRSRQLADNVTDNTALLFRLKERGNVRPVSGGEDILEELFYAENQTYKRYTGYEVLDISPSDVITSASFAWKQAAVAISISGLEQLQNTGPDQMIDLLAARVENAEMTFMNNLSADIYSDGTADGGKQIGGLQLLVADDPTTGTVGGINRATFSFWRNQVTDFTTDIGGASTSSNMQEGMRTLWVKQVRNQDKPDLIPADNDYYEKFWASLQTQQRFTNSRLAEAGFSNLKFNTADVVLDGGVGGDAPSSHMYFLNTRFISYRPHRSRDMVPLDPDRFATNQDAMIKLIGWAGNMTLRNGELQGVLKE